MLIIMQYRMLKIAIIFNKFVFVMSLPPEINKANYNYNCRDKALASDHQCGFVAQIYIVSSHIVALYYN